MPAGSRWSRAVGLVLLVTLGLGLVVPKVAGAGFLLLALMGVLWLSWHRLWAAGDLHPLEHLFVLLIALGVVVWVGAWAWNGFHPAGAAGLGRVLRLLLIIPVFLMLRRTQGLEGFWWSGLIIGAWVAGGYAWWHALTGQIGEFEGRVGGFTNPIYFGGIALVFAMMLVAQLLRIDRFEDRHAFSALRGVVIVAIAMALSASILSGSRGAWFALLPIVVLFGLTLGRALSGLWRIVVPGALVMAALVALMWPGLPTAERLAEIGPALSAAWQGETTVDALGRRFIMWRVVFEEMPGRWWLGAGPGAFEHALQAGIEAGRIDPLLSDYRHPHSQYLSALVNTGLIGLAVFVLLLTVLLRRFLLLWSGGLASTRLLGWCGLVAVTLLAVMALSESIFERNMGIVWFGLLTGGSMGLLQASRRRELLGGSLRGDLSDLRTVIKRQHPLSVMIIALNEVDRIERCLKSVSDWADEVVVFDSGSTDGTVELCRQYTDHVHCTDWPGFGLQKQRALRATRHPWVLSLDADEAISEELKAEIDLALSVPEPDCQAFTLPWATWAFGRWLRHGHWARAPLRLFHRDCGQFTDSTVHERVEVNRSCRVGQLEGALLHMPYRSLAHARQKLASYAQLQAKARAQRRRLPLLPLEPEFRAAFNFIDNYLLRAAFIDGRAGLALSRLTAAYTRQKYRHL
jgi:(heptosyl)LPS beta-1,4-glucosyltransferase